MNDRELTIPDRQLKKLASEVVHQLSRVFPPLDVLNQSSGRVNRESQPISRLERVDDAAVESDPVRDILDLLEEESGNTRQDLLIKSLSLYRRALLAEKQGQKIAILDPDDTIVSEIAGFDVPLSSSLAAGIS